MTYVNIYKVGEENDVKAGTQHLRRTRQSHQQEVYAFAWLLPKEHALTANAGAPCNKVILCFFMQARIAERLRLVGFSYYVSEAFALKSGSPGKLYTKQFFGVYCQAQPRTAQQCRKKQRQQAI